MTGTELATRLQAAGVAWTQAGRAPTAGGTPRGRRMPLSFFALLQLYMAAVVFAGFAPSFYLKPERALAMDPVIHVHAGVMTLWIVFMAVQGVLPAHGRARLHRTLGWWGVGLAALVLITGVMITVRGVHDGWDPFGLGSGEAFAAIPFRDLVTFTVFLGLGVAARKRLPQAHKRLMTLATLSVIPAGLARLAAFVPEPGILILNHAPIAAIVAYDLLTRRRVLTSTWAGSAFLVAATPVCLAMARTEGWQDLVRALT
ncbi:MAG: hypothetical protein ACOY5Y_05680 [Pseudomonadota bacterium]